MQDKTLDIDCLVELNDTEKLFLTMARAITRGVCNDPSSWCDGILLGLERDIEKDHLVIKTYGWVNWSCK